MRTRWLPIILTAGLAGCAGMGQQADTGFLYKTLPIATGSAEAGAGHSVTFKGAPLDGPLKVREEIETGAEDAAVLLAVLERLGFRPVFRYEKFREEFSKGDAVLAIDETPIGTFLEIEGSESGIRELTSALGQTPDVYIRASYRALYETHCREQGRPVTDMLFEDGGSARG